MIDFIGDIKNIIHEIGNSSVLPGGSQKPAVVLPPENPTVVVGVGAPTQAPIDIGRKLVLGDEPVVTNTAIVTPTLIKQNWPTQHTIWSTWSHPGTSAWSHDNLTDVHCPWTLHMDKIVLHSIQINKKVAASLERVLNYIWVKAGSTQEAIEKLHYDRYSGSYNYRPIRGAHALSMHSYGLAIDFDDQENQQHSTKHLFQQDSLIVQAFKGEGWAWGGDWSRGSIDAMHFQAAHV